MIKFTVVLLCLLVTARAINGLAVEDHAAHEIFAEEVDSELDAIAHEENGLDASDSDSEFDSVAQTEQQDANGDDDDAAMEADDDDDMVNDSEAHDDFENDDRQRRRGNRRGPKRVSRRNPRVGRFGVNENRGDRLNPASSDNYRGHRASMRDRDHKGRLGRRPGVSRAVEESTDNVNVNDPQVSEIVLVVEPIVSDDDQPNEVMGEEERHRGRGRHGRRRHGRRCRKHHRRGEDEQEPQVPPRTCIGEGCNQVPYVLPIEVEASTERSIAEEVAVSTPSSAWWWWSS